MKMTYLFRRLPLFMLALLTLSGCGYRIGNLGHPQLKSIAVAPVVNETLSYNLAAQTRNMLCERITTDGTMKLVGESTADCILYARVMDVKFSESASSSTSRSRDGWDQYTPTQWLVKISIEYSLVIPGRFTPLIDKRMVSGSAYFMAGPDLESARANGTRQAAYDAAKKLVSDITEVW